MKEFISEVVKELLGGQLTPVILTVAYIRFLRYVHSLGVHLSV